MSRNKFAVFACLVAMIGVTSCSDSDDVVNLPVTAQAEAAIEGVFNDVVLPLSEFVDGMVDAIIAGQPKGPSLVCPSTEGICTSGSVTCDEDSSGIGLDFDFDSCTVAQAGVTADGLINVTLTGPSSALVLMQGFSIDGGDPMSGSIAVSESGCTETWLVDAGGSAVAGFVSGCGDYPDSQSYLTITVYGGSDVWIFSFSFDGSSEASVWGERNGEPVTTCDVDLDTFATTCYPLEEL